tara:strand:+ start:465 stop:869 length:405 start_codon:yes stop_codon:yes gene_type:complete
MASILKVDTITGVATAGSIAITGEGNSTTTNLQQGLAKGWFHYDGSGTTFADSFNGSSATDRGTGSYDMNYTNNMSSDNYSFYGACMAGGNRHFGGSGDGTPGINTSNSNIQIYDGSSLGDSTHVQSAMHGDLA